MDYIMNFVDIKIKINPWMILFIWLFISGLKAGLKKKKVEKIQSIHWFFISMVMGFILGYFVIPGKPALNTIMSYGVAHAAGAMALYEGQKYFLVIVKALIEKLIGAKLGGNK